MWCIGNLTGEYRRRMYDVLELYARPYSEREPVICVDEKSKQLIRDSREGLTMKPGSPAKCDYEYVRAGTCNVFVAVEPKGGRRVGKSLTSIHTHINRCITGISIFSTVITGISTDRTP